MPLDLRKILEEREEQLSGFIKGIPGQEQDLLSSLVPSIEAKRSQGLRDLGGISGVDPGALNESGARTGRFLGRRLAALSEGRLSDVGRGSVSMKLSEAFRRSGRARDENLSSVGYSRQTMADEINNREALAELSERMARDRDRENISEEYARKGVESQSTQDSDYQAALSRAIFGLVGAAGTGYLLSKGGGGDKLDPYNYAPYSQPGIETLRGQTGFSSTLDPFSLTRSYGYGGRYGR